MLTREDGKMALVRAEDLNCQVPRGLRVEVHVSFGMVTRKRVACEGTAVGEVSDELKVGHGAAGQRTWVGGQMGLAQAR